MEGVDFHGLKDHLQGTDQINKSKEENGVARRTCSESERRGQETGPSELRRTKPVPNQKSSLKE